MEPLILTGGTIYGLKRKSDLQDFQSLQPLILSFRKQQEENWSPRKGQRTLSTEEELAMEKELERRKKSKIKKSRSISLLRYTYI